jgi:NAD(P)-dependent dehydrogenase (short-subunit alcohol dehydrogenase family)
MNKKVVLITGAGRGLGRATAGTFHNSGFEVVATDIDQDLNSDISETPGFTCLKLDVTSESEMQQCADFVAKKFGRLDVLVSNAGIVNFYPVSEAGADKLKKILDVNVLGLANLTKYFSALMTKSKGRLIVIGSESYKVPAPFQPYAVSKQALEALYGSIKIELSLKGVKSILIRPGAIQTHILDKTIIMDDLDEASVFTKEFTGFKSRVPSYIKKVSSPAVVARLVLKAATSKKPKSIYEINHSFPVSLLSIMPAGIQQYLMKKQLQNTK